MKVKEFYDVITQQMTAEEALMKLLEGTVMQYEHLKFEDADTPVHPLFIITMAAMEMGWQIAVENNDDEVNGLVVGTEEYMNKILK